MENTMPSTNILSRLLLIFILTMSLAASGCSYIPWMGNNEEEETVGFEDEIPFDEPDQELNDVSEKDFFGDEPAADDSGGFDEGLNDGFASIDQPTDSGEMKVDLENLQNQQETLNAKVRELQEIISALEPKISATQEQLKGNLGNISQKADFLEPEVNELKLQMAQLKEELAMLKMKSRSGSNKMKSSHSGGMGHKKMGGGVSHSFKMKYDQALSAYRGGQYDESILLFQNLAVMNPPHSYQDNIHYWIGSNFVKLEMFDDAIKHFETVLDKFPRGNKVHDSRFMLGVSYHKKGESSRAIDILQSALRSNPTAEVREKIEKELSQIQ